MRTYRRFASESTITALRSLRVPWAGWKVERDDVVIGLRGGRSLRITATGEDLEPRFECFVITADAETQTQGTFTPAFAEGARSISLLESDHWIRLPDNVPEGLLGHAPLIEEVGLSGTAPPTAMAACRVHDGVLVESGSERLLLHCLGMPLTIEAETNPATIDEVLSLRKRLPL